MKNYKEFEFWRRAHELALDLYKITQNFPKSEIYGISNQIRRASLSVPTNIAEGCGRESKKELRRFLVIASSSISEVEYLILYCYELGLIANDMYIQLNDRILIIKKRITRAIDSNFQHFFSELII